MWHRDGNSDFVGIVRITWSNISEPGIEWFRSDLVGISWHAHALLGADGDDVTGCLASRDAVGPHGPGNALDSGSWSKVDAVQCDLDGEDKEDTTF